VSVISIPLHFVGRADPGFQEQAADAVVAAVPLRATIEAAA
jgi:hypothetical protein